MKMHHLYKWTALEGIHDGLFSEKSDVVSTYEKLIELLLKLLFPSVVIRPGCFIWWNVSHRSCSNAWIRRKASKTLQYCLQWRNVSYVLMMHEYKSKFWDTTNIVILWFVMQQDASFKVAYCYIIIIIYLVSYQVTDTAVHN